MKKLLLGAVMLAIVCSLPACTSKGSTLVPLVSQQGRNQPVSPMDTNGGGPSQNCGENGCPAPDPTP